MEEFLKLFLLFLIYSIIGWLMESALVSFQSSKLINRGFLIGPYCPIYGFGGLIITLYLTQYKDNLFTVFFLAIIVCSILEYFTSYLMEKIFKARWWDYSEEKFNLNGRICGKNALAFGFVSIILLYIINPFIEKQVSYIPNNILMIIAIISLIIFTTDTVFSCNVIAKLRNTAASISATTKDVTVDISKLVKDRVNYRFNILQRRLLRAFPDASFSTIINKYNKLRREFESRSTLGKLKYKITKK